MQNNKHESKFVLVALIAIAFIGYLVFDIRIPCVFYEATSLYCPGCGMTRAVEAIFRLDFYQAIRYNPILIIMVPYFAYYVIIKCINKKRNKKINIDVLTYVVLGITILYWILRNTEQFSFLAPTLIK